MQGKVLSGRYKIISYLGGGGFGQTYLAQDLQLPDTPQCVVKQFKPLATDEKTLVIARRLFDREARTLHQLGCHDQIPRLLAHFEEEGEFYLVQEYIEGNTLTQELEKIHRLSETQVISLVQDILSTLDYVHQQNVIHRDIKPSNIIRRKRDSKLVLIDFGAVKQINQQGIKDQGPTGINTSVSTKGYTPIEQLEGHPRFNSDIYALGITAIEALTGIHPKQLKRDLRTGLVVWREHASVSDEFAAILDKMMHYNAAERYPCVSEVFLDLEKVMRSVNAPTEPIQNFSEIPTQIRPNLSKNSAMLGETHILHQRQKQGSLQLLQPENLNFWLRNPVFQLLLRMVQDVRATLLREPITASMVTQPPASMATQSPASLVTQAPASLLPKSEKQQFQKPKYILGTVVAVSTLLGGLELIHPIFRPIYYLHQGQQLLAQQKPNEALDYFQKLTEKLKPNDPQAWKCQGDIFFKLERYEGALAAYDKALQYKPKDSKILSNKARVLDQLGRYQEALEVQEKSITIAPNNAHSWNSKGLILLSLQRYEEALAAFDKAKSIQPQDPTVWQSKGLALKALKRDSEAWKVYEEALAVYDTTVKNKQNDPMIWTDRGTVLNTLKRSQKALESYEKALKVDPNFYEALIGKANVLVSLNRSDDALKIYDRIVANRKEDYLAWHNRGELLVRSQKDDQEAVKSLDKAVALNPSFYPSYLWKGLALVSLRQYDEALAAFDRAKDIEPKDPMVWANRGFALEKMGRKQDAIASYKKATQIDPKFPEAIDAIKRLQQ